MDPWQASLMGVGRAFLDGAGEAAYYAFRGKLAQELRRQTGPRNVREVADYALHAGAPSELVASEWAERFQRDLERRRSENRRRAPAKPPESQPIRR